MKDLEIDPHFIEIVEKNNSEYAKVLQDKNVFGRGYYTYDDEDKIKHLPFAEVYII
jgi:hypothetical protein